MTEWQPIKTFDLADREKVDLWIDIYPSPRSMGWGDSFRVIDAYCVDGRWLHRMENGEEKEIYPDYVTHWMPPPDAPNGQGR